MFRNDSFRGIGNILTLLDRYGYTVLHAALLEFLEKSSGKPVLGQIGGGDWWVGYGPVPRMGCRWLFKGPPQWSPRHSYVVVWTCPKLWVLLIYQASHGLICG